MPRVERDLPTFWLLSGRTSWYAAYQEGVAFGSEGVSLAPAPGGLLSFSDPNHTLGGLLLPPFLAVDRNGLTYLLAPDGLTMMRFDPESKTFASLPTVGGKGGEARQFQVPRAITIHQDDLYVADPEARRVQVFSVKGLTTRAVWSYLTGRQDLSFDRFLRPGDVSREDAQKVLDFLNSAQTEGEIDEVIELPERRDIGQRLGRRILDRREELGGRFTSLEQVDAIPYIGPLRFTRLVIALTAPPERWRPVDIAFDDKLAYVLDVTGPSVWRLSIVTGEGEVILRGEETLGADPSRIATGKEGEVYVLDAAQSVLREFRQDKWGTWNQVRDYTAPFEVEARFPMPPLRLDHRGRFYLPPELTAECGDCPPEVTPPPADAPMSVQREGGIFFNRKGEAISRPKEVTLGPPTYIKKGEVILGPLDSDVYRCQWHRLAFQWGRLPSGTSFTVWTYADGLERTIGDIRALPDSLWAKAVSAVGAAQPVPGVPQDVPSDALVQSREGRYLWLRIEVKGDGYGSPRLDSIEAHFPRVSHLEHLPAIFQQDPEGEWFLQRFLSIFQTASESVQRQIEDVPRILDPDTVPVGPALDWLSAWIGLTFPHGMPAEHRRRLLKAAIRYFPHRGTPEGLRQWLRTHVTNLSGVEMDNYAVFPFILEHFKLRRWVFLAQEDKVHLNAGGLWGPDVIGRMQLDKMSRLGDVQLLDMGHADRDVIDQYANRFSVFIPSALFPTDQQAQSLKRTIEKEKPAHTQAALHLVEPRFRIGVQATIGMDAILGPYPTMRLASWDAPPDMELRPPHSILGYDSVLAAAPEDVRPPSFELGQQRLGEGIYLT